MIHDAVVEVTCDGRIGAGRICRESIYVELPFTYPDYSGKGGRYDHRPHVVNPKVKEEGWTVVDEDTHLCESCAERAAEAGIGEGG